MNTLTTTVARWIFTLPIMLFGLSHLMNADNMAGMIPQFMPGPANIWVYISGIVLLFSGLSIALKKMDRAGALILALVLLVIILSIHIPNAMSSDEMTKMMGTVNVLKDTAILGGALTYAGLAKS